MQPEPQPPTADLKCPVCTSVSDMTIDQAKAPVFRTFCAVCFEYLKRENGVVTRTRGDDLPPEFRAIRNRVKRVARRCK